MINERVKTSGAATRTSRPGLRVAYLVNQYPMVSLTFIRREIEALESMGFTVDRFSIRPWTGTLVDSSDQREKARTRFILKSSVGALVGSLILALLTRPRRFCQAFWLSVRLGARSDKGVLIHLAYFLEACRLVRWLEKRDIRHLHAHFGTNPTTVAMLCRILGGPPYSFTSHGIEMSDRPGFLGLTEKIRRASCAVAVCEFGRSQLYRQCSHLDWSKVHVVHCGVDEQFLTGAWIPVPTASRLVCVGRLSEEKGQLLLLEALDQLAKEGVTVSLVLVGDGPLRQELERLINIRGLTRWVRIMGWADSDQVRQQILAARALVLPSFAEGLPVVIMEALALGRPVISTYVAGIPELVQPGVNGWLVPAGSVDALAAAIREAVEAPPEQLEAMGRRGAARVAELHDVRKEAAKLAALFRNGTAATDPE